jgi:hypothetical protein
LAFNPKNADDVQQLSKSIGYSWGVLEVFRDNKLDLVKQYVGRHYSKNGADDKVPINLLELAINIYLQRLVAQNPAVDITTEVKELKELCTRFEIAGNQLIEQINLGSTLEMAVVGAIFSKGIVKVAMNLEQVEVGGVLHDTGQPFADYVSLDDWVEDMTADREENGQYEGNYYKVTIDEAEKMYPEMIGKFNQHDPSKEGETEHKVSEGGTGEREEFRPTVKLLDLFLKKQNLVLTCLASDDDSSPIDEVLRVVEWTGRELGPYHKLAFAEIEKNTMPSSPASHWRDLHELANRIFNKLGRQIDRQKTVTFVQGGADADGNRVVNAEDGETIKVDNPNAVKEAKYGGADAPSMAFFLQIFEIFKMISGNLDMLGGLGPQSETLGQDQLLSVSANMRVQRMQKKVVEFTQGILKALMGYLWNDPATTYTVVKKVKNFDDVSVRSLLGPAERSADVMNFNIKIQPYSMQHQTPESKLQGLRTVFAEFISPFIPLMEAQGITIDFEMLFKKIGKLGNIPELSDILVFSSPNHETQMIGGETSRKPPVTKRTYERVNRPGATSSGKSQVLQQALLGNKSQQSEVASLMKATG